MQVLPPQPEQLHPAGDGGPPRLQGRAPLNLPGVGADQPETQLQVLYNDHDLVALWKPYGLHMFPSAERGVRDLETFLPKLVPNLGCHELYEVRKQNACLFHFNIGNWKDPSFTFPKFKLFFFYI